MSNAEQTPEYGRIPEACRRYGLSRSRLYLLAGEGQIRFVKVGSATLVDFGSVRDYLARCPAASVRRPSGEAQDGDFLPCRTGRTDCGRSGWLTGICVSVSCSV